MDTVFMARQAIFDAEKRVYGYELLFREGMTNSFPEICPNEATSKLIEGGFLGSTLVSQVSQVSQHRSFINFTEAYTTQACSCCGSRHSSPKGRAGLGIREWTCHECGTHHDRDVNAAKNILALGHQRLTGGIPVL